MSKGEGAQCNKLLDVPFFGFVKSEFTSIPDFGLLKES
jgi:hypothetical protein